MTQVHRMPFGAQLEDDGVRFALWAPDSRRVGLVLADAQGRERRLPMARRGEGGWAELTTDQAGPGTRYRFEIDDGLLVPDPASRMQADDVHGPSVVVDPGAYEWRDGGWRGRPWEEAVIYELHVGAFSPEGTFDGVRARLGELADLGVTVVELMPLADFPGRRNWGYDGALLYAPDRAYGGPDDLRRLVDEAHRLGLMVMLDVVHNHFGPEGNYLWAYARSFFDTSRHTPWGAAIAFDGPAGETVRSFFVHNALCWLEEFHLDGLRLDAVHAMHDRSKPGFLRELAQAVAEGPGAERLVHLVLENDDNAAELLRPSAPGRRDAFVAQWNDDMHHVLHLVLTGEADGYYADYADEPMRHLERCLLEGFAFQGERSLHRGADRGQPTAGLPPSAFVGFTQNHDQIGNRALGERLDVLVAAEPLEAALALLLLAPSTPLLFMGQEWGAREPFLFFCDFGDDLREAVTAGRRKEFSGFSTFGDPYALERIPDPSAVETFERSRLRWEARAAPGARRRLALTRELLALRRDRLAPRLRGTRPAGSERLSERVLRASWSLGDGSTWTLLANLGPELVRAVAPIPGEVVYNLHAPAPGSAARGWPAGELGPYRVVAVHGPGV